LNTDSESLLMTDAGSEFQTEILTVYYVLLPFGVKIYDDNVIYKYTEM